MSDRSGTGRATVFTQASDEARFLGIVRTRQDFYLELKLNLLFFDHMSIAGPNLVSNPWLAELWKPPTRSDSRALKHRAGPEVMQRLFSPRKSGSGALGFFRPMLFRGSSLGAVADGLLEKQAVVYLKPKQLREHAAQIDQCHPYSVSGDESGYRRQFHGVVSQAFDRARLDGLPAAASYKLIDGSAFCARLHKWLKRQAPDTFRHGALQDRIRAIEGYAESKRPTPLGLACESLLEACDQYVTSRTRDEPLTLSYPARSSACMERARLALADLSASDLSRGANPSEGDLTKADVTLSRPFPLRSMLALSWMDLLELREIPGFQAFRRKLDKVRCSPNPDAIAALQQDLDGLYYPILYFAGARDTKERKRLLKELKVRRWRARLRWVVSGAAAVINLLVASGKAKPDPLGLWLLTTVIAPAISNSILKDPPLPGARPGSDNYNSFDVVTGQSSQAGKGSRQR